MGTPLKFVRFEKNDKEDFQEPETVDQYDGDVDDDDVDVEDDDEDPRLYGLYGGINENWTWVKSQYFERLDELGDFKAATYELGGYCRPYIDFGISEIHKKYYYVIG